MRIGISTACLYPLETELALEAVGKLGVADVEIFINASCELKLDFLRRLKDIARHYGLNIVSLHPYISVFEPFQFFTNYERRYRDGLSWYEDYFRAANFLGAEVMVVHGDRRDGPLLEEEIFDRHGELFRRARARGILLAQENVERSRSRSSAYIRRMSAYLGEDVRFVLDLKQALRADEDPFEMLDAMGDKLVHLHLSDSRPGMDCLPPGEGIFDFAKLARRARSHGYDGCGMIELYQQNYKEFSDLLESFEYLTRQMNENFRQNTT